jgi:nitrite reductase/ring-hydroxylating ferredoxin subunit
MTSTSHSSEHLDLIARVDDLPLGTMQARTLSSGDKVCVIHTHAGICVLADRCSHRDFPLSQGDVTAEGLIECAWHGAQFDPVTGVMLTGPGGDDVPTYEVSIQDGMIAVSLQARMQ